MRFLARFGRFWWDFLVGDDPLVAVVVAAALGLTAALAALDVATWWLLPLAAVGLLAVGTRREAAKARRELRRSGP